MPSGFTQKWSSSSGSRADVAGRALVEAEVAEQPERGRQALLAMTALVLDGAELRVRGRSAVGRHGRR
jgi:hypothetical protein